MATKKETFEDNMKRLEEIVASLEAGETPLNECMKQFEEGVKLSRSCMKMLDQAEQKIKALTEQPDGDLAETDFVPNEESF